MRFFGLHADTTIRWDVRPKSSGPYTPFNSICMCVDIKAKKRTYKKISPT